MASTLIEENVLPKSVRALHWTSALIIFLAIGLAWGRELLDGDSVSTSMLSLHRQLGLVALLLWALRLTARWAYRRRQQEVLPALLRYSGVASHLLLYLVLLAMPLLGWALTNAQGHPVSLLNVVPLPTLAPVDPDLADALEDWHKGGAWLLIGLTFLHVIAAIWHHWVRRDGVLVSMCPSLSHRKKQSAT
jgi:cytochrome b561